MNEQMTRGLGFPKMLSLIVTGAMTLATTKLSSQQSVAPGSERPPAAASIPTYDVATIKRFKPDGSPTMYGMQTYPDGFTSTHFALKSLICMAYGVNDYQVSGGPTWVESDGYDLVAKMDESSMETLRKLDPTRANLMRQRMLQALLADRFKLTLHHETKQLPIFALVVAKGGTKLHVSASVAPSREGNSGPGGKEQRNRMMMSSEGRGALMTAEETSMDTLAMQLTGELHSTVENKTGLDGSYDFTLRYTPEYRLVDAADPSATGNASIEKGAAPSIFIAVEDQLGLKLEKRKGPADVVVIDHVEKPSEN